MPIEKVVVFVHGWSVTNTDTYGGLPVRLREQAKKDGIEIQVKEIFLGKYISFHDEVRLKDISKAFQAAVEDQLKNVLQDGNRFVCITHSTGGPVVRDWWHRYYWDKTCPMSHLVMLAPANYGSALAQLGKGRLSRLTSWFEGVEPGQGVLDWLELGSSEGWKLNTEWITNGNNKIDPDGVFPFVLTGQFIDRAFYDNLNAYTGEIGSDGVVRVAAANLRGTYIKLVQESPKSDSKGKLRAENLEVKAIVRAPESAMRIISGRSHSGKDMGIMRSVKEDVAEQGSLETVGSILACIKVQTKDQFDEICKRFEAETDKVQEEERLEVEKSLFLSPRHFIHDRCSMIIFRLHDNEGYAVTDFDLLLTDGPNSDPNHLPEGFFIDRQRNRINPETITYFVNYDVMKGSGSVKTKEGKVVRKKLTGAETLGFKINARPAEGFVHYLPCEFKATPDMLEKALYPNSTTLVDIQLQRVVHKNVFRLEKMDDSFCPKSFKDSEPGDGIVDTK